MEGLLAPVLREKLLGKAEVRQVFKIPKVGTIAGCYVTEGKITPQGAGAPGARRGGQVYTGKIGSLRRFKDDVNEVAQGYECGIGHRELQRPQGGRHHRGVRDRGDRRRRSRTRRIAPR